MIRILCLHIAENQASYRYRVEQFLPYWKQYGIEMHTAPIVGKSYREKLRIAFRSNRYDYVWLQRKPLTSILTTIITRRSRLLYDYDDALYAIESYRNEAPKPVHPGSRQTIKRLNRILKHSSLVFAGSEALARYAKTSNPSNTFIVPTAYEKVPVPEESMQNHDTVTIGWIGNVGNLYFLSMIDDITATIQERFPSVKFSLLSGKPAETLRTRWDFEPWSKEKENSWLQSIDIGIMPLVDDEWSRGKCAFKLLQYMACGKPVVASAVGANMQAVLHGVSGFLAGSAEQWLHALETLISSPDLRKSMGRESLNHFLATFERQRVQEQMATIIHNHHHDQINRSRGRA